MKKLVLLMMAIACLLPLNTLSAADSGIKTDKPLVIGIFPRRDPAITMKLFKPLGKYLQEALGQSVRVETTANYKAFQKQLEQRKYDVVHFNQYHYVKAHEPLGYEVLVQNEEFGEPKISGAVYVRKDSGIETLPQLKGKTILFGGGKRAMMSYIVPTYLLRQSGMVAGDYVERFAASPPNAVLATFLRQVDAGGAGEVVRRLPLVTKKIDTKQLQLLAVSDPLPHLPWAVKKEMDSALHSRLKAVLIGLKETEEGRKVLKSARLTAFNPAKDADYDIHRAMISRVENQAGDLR